MNILALQNNGDLDVFKTYKGQIRGGVRQESQQRCPVMKTTTLPDDVNEPAWLRDETPAVGVEVTGSSSMNPFQFAADNATTAGTGEPVAARVAARRRRRRIYDDSDDDLQNEDCCCCPTDPCLIAFSLFHLCGGLLGVAAAATNAYHITQPPSGGNRVIDIIQRCYCIAFGAIITLIEIDWKFLSRRLKLLDLWVFRGLFYAYVGLSTLDLFSPTVETPECIVGFSLILCGGTYVVMGALCLKSVAARRKRNYTEITDDGPETVYESV